MSLFLSLLFSFPALAADLVKVVHVYDGDTIRLEDGRRVRLIGINAPEVRHPESNGRIKPAEQFGETARQYLQKRLLHKKIVLKNDREQQDHYHRTLAYVFLPDGTFINEELISEGLAYCLYKRPNDRYENRLLLAQQMAMRSGKGIWGNGTIVVENSGSSYIGNIRSRRFHKPECPLGKKINPKNRKNFARLYDAFYHGYAPCKRCIVIP